MRILTAVLLIVFSCPALGYGKILTLATWNLDNFTATAGKALQSHAPKRTEADFTRLAQCAARIDADVTALQEVASPDAVARLYPPERYTTLFSSRYTSKMRGQRDIFNALVLKNNSVRLLRQEDLRNLALGSAQNRRWTRFGVAALLEVRGLRIWVLNVHLKAGCNNKSLKRTRGRDCKALVKQGRALGRWITEKLRTGTPFVLMGDFNRRINRYGARDHLWQILDPSGTELVRFPATGKKQCPRHHGENFIDYFLLDRQAAAYAVRDSFEEVLYRTTDKQLLRGLSDHCPLRLNLDLGLDLPE